MKKNISQENKIDDSNKSSVNSRRKALKAALATSGVVIGSSAVSSEWVRPLVDSVILPAHAQTSGASGAFGTGNVTTLLQPQDDLLDMLVPSAMANDDFVGHSTCGIDEGPEGQPAIHYAGSGAFQVMFNITGTSVAVCVSSLGGPTIRTQQCTKSGVTTLNGSAIADLDILMDADLDVGEPELQETAKLTNMAVSGGVITGNLEMTTTAVDQTCSNGFTAPQLGTAYVCNESCTGPSEGG